MPAIIKVVEDRPIIKIGENSAEAARYAGLAVAAAARAEATADEFGALVTTNMAKNRANPNLFTAASYLNTAGARRSDPGWMDSGFIDISDVDDGSPITISWAGTRQAGLAFFAVQDGNAPLLYDGSTAPSPLTVIKPAGANYLIINIDSTFIDEPTKVQVEVGPIATAFQAWKPPVQSLNAEKISIIGPRLVLNGDGQEAYVESAVGGHLIRRTFNPFPTNSGAGDQVFNWSRDDSDGSLVRIAHDDVAPVRFYFDGANQVLGANHGHVLNRSLKLMIDGKEVTARTGEFGYQDRVEFIERYDIEYGGTVYATLAQSYIFDRFAQCTIPMSLIARAFFQLRDWMGLQAMSTIATAYYIPHTIAHTHMSQTVNFAVGDLPNNAGWTSEQGINFTPDKCEASGPYPDSAVLMSGSVGLAAGFLPLYDAAPAVRRANTSNKCFMVQGDTAKLYFAIIDKGLVDMVVGDQFNAVAYRHIVHKSGDQVADYAVSWNGLKYRFGYFVGASGTRSVAPLPDTAGKPSAAVQSRNITVIGRALSGDLSLDFSGPYSTFQEMSGAA